MQSETQRVSMSQGPINVSIKNLFNGQKLTINKLCPKRLLEKKPRNWTKNEKFQVKIQHIMLHKLIKNVEKKYSVRTDLNLCNTRSFKHFFIIFVHQMFKDLKLSAIKYNVEKATKQSSSGEEKNVS